MALNIGAGGYRQYVIPPSFLSFPCRIRTELCEFGRNMVKYCVLLHVCHDSFLVKKRGVQELHEFRRIVVISIFGISHDIGGGNEGWYIITYLTVD